jgi:urea transport system substrate-binding protein
MNTRTIVFLLFLMVLGFGGWVFSPPPSSAVKIGILHSLSGTMKISEHEVARVTAAAFEEINRKGGILGQPIHAIIVDGQSDPARFADAADELITRHKVKAIFGCWTSSSRKEVKPILEKHNHLLFYPVQYEGFESSPNIVYLGQIPNQQILPAIKFAADRIGKRVFLVGSDYIFPRAANLYIKETGAMLGIDIAGEAYVPLGGKAFALIVTRIKKSRPDVIFNTLNGDSNLYFFRELYAQGITAAAVPVISFSIADTEVESMSRSLPPEALRGHYASMGYFASIDTPENRAFKAFLKRHAIRTKPNDAMEAAYIGAYLYKQAVEECGSFDPSIVQRCLGMQSFNAPGGIIYIDHSNNHAWKKSRIAIIDPTLSFSIRSESTSPIPPKNYPTYKSVEEWNAHMIRLHERKGEHP